MTVRISMCEMFSNGRVNSAGTVVAHLSRESEGRREMPEYKGTKATRHGTKGPFRYRDTESLRHPSRWVTCEMKRNSRGRLFYMGLCLGAFVGLLTILPLVAGGCAEDHSM